jgi:hypothetical protein
LNARKETCSKRLFDENKNLFFMCCPQQKSFFHHLEEFSKVVMKF